MIRALAYVFRAYLQHFRVDLINGVAIADLRFREGALRIDSVHPASAPHPSLIPSRARDGVFVVG